MNHKIHYLLGDVTKPVRTPAIIAHVCNDIGGWGRGVVLAIGKAYPESERAYREWFHTQEPPRPELGRVQTVTCLPVHVANMIAQHGIRWQGKIPPIRYDALEECLKVVYGNARRWDCTVHMPRIGSVLAGGKWPEIHQIIERTITVETYVYTLPEQKDRWDDEYEGAQ